MVAALHMKKTKIWCSFRHTGHTFLKVHLNVPHMLHILPLTFLWIFMVGLVC